MQPALPGGDAYVPLSTLPLSFNYTSNIDLGRLRRERPVIPTKAGMTDFVKEAIVTRYF